MIQRIQTIFLAICAIVFILFLFIPVILVTVDGNPVSISAISGFTSKFSYSFTFSIVAGFDFIAIGASIIAILSYRQRYLQIRFCYIIAFIAVLFLALLNLTDLVDGYNSYTSVPFLTNILLVVVLICSILASIFIKKDINLLKKADRIR